MSKQFSRVLLQVLLPSKVRLSGFVSFAKCRGHCCSMTDEGCIGARDCKHVSGTFEGFGASSSGCEPAVLVRDVNEGSCVGVDEVVNTAGGVSVSGGTM